MARLNVIINKFTGGEVSPDVWGRTDTDQWPSMVEEMRNVISDPRGGAKRRDGLHYVLPTKFPQLNSRLIPFVFSREQSYMLEFGDYYVRFYRDQGYVEDIGSVSTYLGDGTSTAFMYPYPDVVETDIVVYDQNGELVPDTEYTVTDVTPGLDYMPGFDDADWDVDPYTTGNPWVKSGTTIISPDGFTTIMGNVGVALPIGGEYKYSVDITGVQYTKTEKTDTRIADILLTAAFSTAAQLTADTETDNDATIDYDISFEDLSGTRTSDFTWQVLHNSTVIASGTELAVGAIPARVQGSVQATEHIYVNDTLTLQASAVGDHNQSLPNVVASQQATVLTGSYVTNAGAILQYDVTPNNDTTNWTDVETTVGTKVLLDMTESNSAPAPYDFVFRCENGVQVTLENPVFSFNNDGYIITFNAAPAVGEIRLIRDETVDTTAERVRRSQISARAAGDIFEIQSPFSADELEDLYFAQANDVMMFAHDLHKPWRLTRYNPYDWRFEQPTLIGAPWEGDSDYAVGDGSKTVFDYTFDSTVDADVAVYFNDDLQTSGYAVDHGAKEVTFTPAPADGMRVVIQGINTYNPLDGYPRTVVFFQERLYFGGTVAKPQTLWGSRSADFYYFAIPSDPLAPDDAVIYTIAAYTHEAIEWLSSERVLVIGTSSTEHRLAPDQYIATDRLPTVSRMSAYGGAHVMPAFMGNLTVFVQASGAQVRTFEQSGQSIIEKWDSIELDWMADHLTAPKVKQIGYALMRDSILFMVTLDGTFLTMTYEPGQGEKGEMGWGKHNTDGLFKSCAVMPEGDRDEIWAIVERTIDGVSRRYVEFFDNELYTDSTLTYPPDDGNNYPALQSVGGLDHLEGKTVTIVGDGATHPDMTVIDGMVVLEGYYSDIKIGLKYIPRIKLQKFAMASQPSNLQGQMGRWVEVWLRLVNSAYPLVDGTRASERQAATPMDTVEPIVTSDVKIYNVGYDRNKQLIIEQDLPMPMHITAVYGVMEVNQG